MAYPAGVTLGIAGLVVSAAAVTGSVLGNREACSHFNPEYGPLGTVDGHSILPRDNPWVQLSRGEARSVMSGLIVNCGSEPVTVTGVEVISDAGDAAEVLETFVMPVQSDHESGVPGGQSPGDVAAPPTGDHPDLALYSTVKGVRDGFYSINGLQISYRHRGKDLAQVFATNVAIEISGGP